MTNRTKSTVAFAVAFAAVAAILTIAVVGFGVLSMFDGLHTIAGRCLFFLGDLIVFLIVGDNDLIIAGKAWHYELSIVVAVVVNSVIAALAGAIIGRYYASRNGMARASSARPSA